MERYRKAIVRELEAFFAHDRNDEEADTIYFGGGTPSLLPAEHIAQFLSACRRSFPISEGCEISLEANPGTLSRDKASAYREVGINRISIGAQSFDDQELASIGRIHTSFEVEESLSLLAETGFDNLSLDLMLGLPDQTEETWTRNLEKLICLAPQHVSVYMLDLDDKSPLYYMIAKGRFRTPEDDLVADWYLQTVRHLCSRGYDQYEISNFARPGYSCRHNLKYWMREPVLAFGVGSHSFDGRSRYANHSRLNDYLQAVEAGSSPVERREPVAASQALEETLFLGLRLNRGVDWRRLQGFYDGDRLANFETSLREMSDRGLLEWKDSIVRLTPLGMLLSNEIFQQFV